MKIAFLAPEFLPNWGGAGTYSIELVKYLSKKNDVHVITLRRQIEGSDLNYTDEAILNYFDNKIQLHTITDASDTFLYNAKFQYSVFRILPRLCEDYGIEIVHADVPHLSDILLKFKFKFTNFNFKVPSVTTIHTVIEGHKEGIKASGLKFSEMDASEKYTLALFPLLRLAQSFYLRRSKHFITVSNWMREILLKNYPISTDINVIHNGVDHRQFSPEKKALPFDLIEHINSPIVLFSGRLISLKGVHILIKAMGHILKETKDVYFVFAGAGNTKTQTEMLNKSGVSPSNYVFLGYEPYQDMPCLYAKSSIFVLPSLIEDFPFCILEAMSSENAIVATNVGGISEAITDGENGILIHPKNPDELANSILLLLGDEKYADRLGKNARETILNRFTWDKIGIRTEMVYKNILEGEE
jgi:glycosyltransferase involved in cell wall biosynthesis